MASIPSEGKGKIVVPFVDPDRSPMAAGIVDAGAISNPNEMAAIAPFASAAPEEKDGGVAPFVEPLDENKLPTTIIKASTGTGPTSNEMAAIAPFASISDAKARMVAPFLEPYGDGNPSMTHPPFADPSAGKALIRPKVFGPERVVEDPRVKAVHERFMWQMYLLALYGSVVSLRTISRRNLDSGIHFPRCSRLSFSQFRVVIILDSLLPSVMSLFHEIGLNPFMYHASSTSLWILNGTGGTIHYMQSPPTNRSSGEG